MEGGRVGRERGGGMQAWREVGREWREVEACRHGGR